MKRLFFLALPCLSAFLFLSSRTTAQSSFDERYLLSSGFTAVTDFTKAPSFANADSTKVLAGSGFSLLSYTITPRISLFEFSEHAALSLETPLSLSLHVSTLGLGSVNVPVLLAYNYGTVATRQTAMAHGFSAGLGVEYTQIGLLKFTQEESVKPRYSWVQPVLAMAYRYRGRRYKAKEINLKMGYAEAERVLLKGTDATLRTIHNPVTNRTLSLKVSFVRYVN